MARERAVTEGKSSTKVRVALIGAGGVIVAAIIAAVATVASGGGGNGNSSSKSVSSSKITITVAPQASPTPTPSVQPFRGTINDLATGHCAYVFATPHVVEANREGCEYDGQTVEIYCTDNGDNVNASDVNMHGNLWDLIYYPTSWGSTAWIPDVYVYTGQNTAVRGACS
jgi:hypothetical protein